jgi:hypothetical protein
MGMEFFPNKDWSKTYTTAAEAIYGVTQYTDKNYLTFIDVFGLTGHAFRMNIDPEIINVAGPTSFPGGYIFRRNLCNLGFTSSMTEMNTLITPEIMEQTMNLVQKSIDKGIPVLSLDLFIPEFGVIYGYDDELQVFHGKDVSQDGQIPYSKVIGERLTFLVAIDESLQHSKYEMLRMALDMIVEHARGREWTHVFKDRFAQGLSGYDAWIGVMERRAADEFGNAYNLAVIADAREYAVRFLHELKLKWNGTNVVERNVRRFAGEAFLHYKLAADSLIKLRSMFPFPQGGNPKDPAAADQAIELLKIARDAESQGVTVLEGFLDFMKAYHSELWIHDPETLK